MAADPDLAGLLEATRKAALAGDIGALAGLAAQTEAAILSGLPGDHAILMALRHAANRNASLLRAAQKGVAAARRRLAELGDGSRFSTYDAAGRRGQIGDLGNGAPRRL